MEINLYNEMHSKFLLTFKPLYIPGIPNHWVRIWGWVWVELRRLEFEKNSNKFSRQNFELVLKFFFSDRLKINNWKVPYHKRSRSLTSVTEHEEGYSPPDICLFFVREFTPSRRKEKLFGAGYPLIWFILNDYSPQCRGRTTTILSTGNKTRISHNP